MAATFPRRTKQADSTRWTMLRAVVPVLTLPIALGLAIGCAADRDGDGQGSTSTAGGIGDTSDGASGSGIGGDDDGGDRFDVGGGSGDGGGGGGNNGDCTGGGTPDDEYEFSIIWIANSPEGTVSKIDTTTATELARYRSGPDQPDPSRTSVNLRGDVAVANRAGSVTKIAARLEDCVDRNGDGAIQTSQGPDDILDWEADECVLWHHDIDFPSGLGDNQGGPRGIAWDGGKELSNGCSSDPNLWVGWRRQPDDIAMVRKLDGNTGQLLGEVEIPDWQGNWGHGTYGGAADSEGGFWALGTLATLIYIEPETLDVHRWDHPDAPVLYGLALDADGTPWMGGWNGNLWRFDLATEQFEDMGSMEGPGRLRGLAVDGDGYVWVAGNEPCYLVQYDSKAETLVNGAIELDGCNEPVGISIDAEGYVWVVDRGSNRAYKVDPSDYSADVVEGLVGPYTYSDMTGAGLDLVVNPPEG